MILPIDTNVFPWKKGVYLVGGSIRDLLCQRTPIDYDLVVTNDPARFARELASSTAGHVVEFGEHGHTVLRTVTADYYFDITPLNGASIEDDLQRRDFTINALALEVSTGKLVDPAGGRQDLAAKKIRMVSRDVFRKDPVRLIRAYRMAATFNFIIDKDTEAAISRDAALINNSAAERIKEELFKILKSTGSHAQLACMAHSGLLFSVFPELLQLKKYPAGDNQPANLFEQTLDAYHHLEKLLYSRELTLPAPGDRLLQDIDSTRAILLKWAVLLQNIGQSSARQETAGETLRFEDHAALSATMAREICRKLKFSRRQSETIEFIIRHHLEPLFVFNARRDKASDDRAFIRFFMRCGDHTPAILLQAMAGFISRRASQDPAIQAFSEFVIESIDNYYSVLRPRALKPPPLTGRDLIKEFGLKPSAAFKQILKAIEEEHLARQNLTREQALELVEKMLKEGLS
jgi:tRNA nucleotidyltransferase/poly(A) polymerase